MKRTGVLLIAAALFLGGGQVAMAADLTWGSGGGGGAGTWDTNNTVNWYDPLIPGDVVWTADGNAIFAGAAGGAVSLDAGGVSANKLTFNTDGYTLQNNTLNMSGAEVNVAGGMTATISSAITGTAGLNLTGTGTLALNGSNTGLSGNVAVGNGATLQIGDDNALGSGWLTGYAQGATIMAVGGARVLSNRLDCVGITIAGTQNIKFTSQWGSNTGAKPIVITNTGVTEFAGSWAPSTDPGGAMDIGGGPSPVNIVLSGTNNTVYSRTNFGNTAYAGTPALNGTVTISGTMNKQWFYLFGNNNNPSDSVFTVKVASDTAFVPDPASANPTQAHQIYAYRGVTFQAEGGPRTIHQTLLGRGVNFTGSNALTFDCADGGNDGVSAVLRSAPPGDATDWYSFNGGRVTFNTGVKTDGAIPFEVRGTTGTMVVNGTANFQAGLTVASGNLLINGTMSAGDASNVVVNGGALGGVGTLSRGVTVNALGTLSPGDPAVASGIGTLTISAAATTIAGTMAMDVSGAGAGSCDALTLSTPGSTLDITGSTLNLNVLSALDDTAYVLATYQNLVGTFGSVLNLPTGYAVNYNYNSLGEIALVQSVGWPYIPGDFNKDGQVGPEDFGLLKDNFGTSNLPYGSHQSWTLGDANDDGQIGPEDFGLLKDNFGASGGWVGPTPLTNVPEPTTMALLALGAIGLIRRRRAA